MKSIRKFGDPHRHEKFRKRFEKSPVLRSEPQLLDPPALIAAGSAN
jgi:hypothetical protein